MKSKTNAPHYAHDNDDKNEAEDNININEIVNNVSSKSNEWANLSLQHKYELLRQVLENAHQHKEEWIACQENQKGVNPNNPLHGYGSLDIMVGGPATFGAYANGILTSLEYAIQNDAQAPPPPISTKQVGDRTIATVWPRSNNLVQSLEAFGMTAEIVCDVKEDDEPLQDSFGTTSTSNNKSGGVAAILAAGNFDAPTDLLSQLFIKGRVCICKPNPINTVSIPILEKILEPLISASYVTIFPDPNNLSATKELLQHPDIDEIVLTGSKATLDKIVWGDTNKDQAMNRRNKSPINTKPICAELGGGSPWIIVPGPQWNSRSVDKHARAVAFAKMANGGHICVSPQVIVLPRKWEFRSLFMDRLRYWLSQHPTSAPFYPGSLQMHAEFGQHRNAELIEYQDSVEDVYPNQQRPILITDMDTSTDQEYLKREAWSPVLMELPIDFDSKDEDEAPMVYLREAIQICQQHLYGSLSVAILINNKTMKRHEKEFNEILVHHLPYGIVGINIWPILANSMSQVSWGAFPGHEQSGIGILGNVNLYCKPTKTILRAPFSYLPRRLIQVTKPQKVRLLFKRFTTYKMRPNLVTQTGLFLALFLGI